MSKGKKADRTAGGSGRKVLGRELSQIQRKLRDTHPLPPARPCGEGVYAVVRHAGYTHLAYALELPEYPSDMLNLFGDRRFHPADPVGLLDCEGAEILIARRPVAAGEDPAADLMPEHETAETSEVFRVLRLRAGEVPMGPLFEGHWA